MCILAQWHLVQIATRSQFTGRDRVPGIYSVQAAALLAVPGCDTRTIHFYSPLFSRRSPSARAQRVFLDLPYTSTGSPFSWNVVRLIISVCADVLSSTFGLAPLTREAYLMLCIYVHHFHRPRARPIAKRVRSRAGGHREHVLHRGLRLTARAATTPNSMRASKRPCIDQAMYDVAQLTACFVIPMSRSHAGYRASRQDSSRMSSRQELRGDEARTA